MESFREFQAVALLCGHLHGFGVLDLLGLQEVPVLVQTARLLLLTIREDSISVVGAHNERVHVRELICFAIHGRLHQQVLSLVVKDGVDSLGAVSADIGTEHDAAQTDRADASEATIHDSTLTCVCRSYEYLFFTLYLSCSQVRQWKKRFQT